MPKIINRDDSLYKGPIFNKKELLALIFKVDKSLYTNNKFGTNAIAIWYDKEHIVNLLFLLKNSLIILLKITLFILVSKK